MRTTPPAWMDGILRSVLKPEIFLTVSGDLLEQYRDNILPSRGLRSADQWYLRQVIQFVCRKIMPWAVLFAVAQIGRGLIDGLVPATDFHLRSQVSTGIAAGLLLIAGFWTAWRSGSFLAGVIAGLAMTAASALLTICSMAIFLSIWHDPETMTGFALSGGLGELFTLPIMVLLPGALLGAVGGIIGARVRRITRIA